MPERLVFALTAARSGTWDWDVRSGKVTWFGGSDEVFALPTDRLGATFEAFLDLVYAPDRERVRREVEEALKEGSAFVTEYRVVLPDGALRWVQARGRVFRDDAGLPVRMAGMFLDFDEQHALREQARRHELVFASMYDAVILSDMEGGVTDWNHGAERQFGYRRDEMLGQRVSLLYADRGDDLLYELIDAVRRDGQWTGEIAFRRKDGSVGISEAFLAPMRDAFGEINGFLGVNRDVTARRHAEAALGRSERHFRSLVEHGTDLITVVDAQGRILYESPSMLRLMGYAPDEVLGQVAFDFVHPDDLERVRETFGTLAASPGAMARVEYRFRHADGSWRYFDSTGRNLVDDEAVGGVVVNSRDVMDRRRMEQALHEANEQLERRVAERTADLLAANRMLEELVEEQRRTEQALQASRMLLAEAERIAHLGSWRIAPAAETPSWSEEMFRILGLDPATAAPGEATYLERVAPEDRARVQGLFAAVRHGVPFDTEWRVIRPDGEVRIIHGIGRADRDAQGRVTGVFGTDHDITERRRLEQELVEIGEQERQRVGRDLHDGLGQQLAGITYLAGALERRLARNSPPDAPDAAEIRRLLEDAIDQTRSLSRLLLPVELEDQGLPAAVRRLARHVQTVYDLDCTAVVDRACRPLDRGVALHLYRIVQEAVHNALRHGGARTLRIGLHERPEGLVLSVHDDGSGFDHHADSAGGAGMRTMRYRAQLVGAGLSVAPSPGGGTVVTCILPGPPPGSDAQYTL